MNITDIRTCDLKPYENNPRLNEDADVIIKRWEDYTGEQAELISDAC